MPSAVPTLAVDTLCLALVELAKEYGDHLLDYVR
jgi:hypothetical protein